MIWITLREVHVGNMLAGRCIPGDRTLIILSAKGNIGVGILLSVV